MISEARLREDFAARFGRPPAGVVFAPGRVNLIGEHIDYHGGPVLPMALEQGVSIAWAPRDDGRVVAAAANGSPDVDFPLTAPGSPRPGGDWSNYLRAAADELLAPYPHADVGAVDGPAVQGADLWVAGDVPEASGLSSSSALVVATGLALRGASNSVGDLDDARRRDLATRFALAERYVGTAGGGMDQAASLGGTEGHALRISFDPLDWTPVPLPSELAVIVAHSGVRAEKSGAARERYNAIRAGSADPRIADHIRSEKRRVDQAVALLTAGAPGGTRIDLPALGTLVDASHESLRARLRVSHPVLDRLCAVAREHGAVGARLTGAGMGGSIVALARQGEAPSVREALRRLQASLPGADPAFIAVAGRGARVTYSA